MLVSLEEERHAIARGIYLSGWSGKEGYRFDRIMRGTTFLPKFALSVVGGIQPGPLARLIRSAYSGERADGLLQRIQLVVWPDPQPYEYVGRYPMQAAKEVAAELFKRADQIGEIGQRDSVGDDPPVLRLVAGAQELFASWLSDYMRERRAAEAAATENSAVAAHFGKSRPGRQARTDLARCR